MESLGFVDCELALLVRLISHLRELIIYKFDKYSLFVLLRGLIKLSYGKLSVLVDTAYDNKSIANLIADITDTISKHYEKATTE